MLDNSVPIVCLNLLQNEERYLKSIEEFNKLGIKEVEYFKFKKDNHIGGNYGIYYICNEMLKKDIPYFWYFEDDIEFTDNFWEMFNLSWNQLQKYEWNIFYLGGSVMQPSKLIEPNLVKLTKFYATHGTCFKKNIAKLIVENLDAYLDKMPLDVWIDENIVIKGNCYMSYPMIGYQKPFYSDIENRYVNYTPILNDLIIKNVIK